MEDTKDIKPLVTRRPVERLVSNCPNCGLPQTLNPHPNAGKPKYLNVIGASVGCLPCAEKRANGRHRLIADLKAWCSQFGDDDFVSPRSVLEMIEKLDEERKATFGRDC